MSTRLFLTAASGWILIALLGLTISLPYRWRRQRLAAPPAADPPPLWRRRLRWHYWLGYGIALLALAHGSIAMTREVARRVHPFGIELASVALLLAFAEVACGMTLHGRLSPRSRLAGRRLHFWTMALLVALVAVHVGLDSALLGTLRLR